MKFSSTVFSEKQVQSFLSAGFSPALNKCDLESDVYLTKEFLCSQLPYVLANIVDDNVVYSEDTCSIDIFGNGNIQLFIHDADLPIQYDKTKSPDEWLKIIEDAGVTFV